MAVLWVKTEWFCESRAKAIRDTAHVIFYTCITGSPNNVNVKINEVLEPRTAEESRQHGKKLMINACSCYTAKKKKKEN
jgi:hypothetical protein